MSCKILQIIIHCNVNSDLGSFLNIVIKFPQVQDFGDLRKPVGILHA